VETVKKGDKFTFLGSDEKSGFHRMVVGDDDENFVAVNTCPVQRIKVEEMK
jgi:hypothetical protein